MKISEAITNYRKEHNLSQEQLANEIGVTRQAISKWEQEKGVPDIENLILLSDEMNISLDELIRGNTPVKKKIINDEKAVKYHLLVILYLVAIVLYIAYFAIVHNIFMVGFLIATLFMLGIELYIYTKTIRVKSKK